MRSKILNVLLIITSLFGYLEWGENSRSFLFETEATLFLKLFTDPVSVLHPFTILPLVGQVILLITLFQKTPSKVLTFIGIAGLALLLGFIFVIGIISGNFRILLSTIPFLLVAFLTIRYYRSNR